MSRIAAGCNGDPKACALPLRGLRLAEKTRNTLSQRLRRLFAVYDFVKLKAQLPLFAQTRLTSGTFRKVQAKILRQARLSLPEQGLVPILLAIHGKFSLAGL